MRRLGERGELRFETVNQRKDGTTFPVEVSSRLIQVEGNQYLQAVVRDITQRKEAEQEVRESRQQLRELTAFLESVREEERTRVAREVHDELGQILTALKLNVGWLSAKLEEQGHPLAEKATALAGIADEAIASARTVAASLRPKMLDDLGLAAAIEWQAGEFEKRTGISCTVHLDHEEPALDGNRASAVFRILQESLTNVARHAAATEVNIALKLRRNMLLLRVQDNGQGFDPAETRKRKSFGLLGMTERALMLKGKAKVRTAPGKGTEVSVLVPLLPSPDLQLS
jgi:signal transduction histidine kinase